MNAMKCESKRKNLTKATLEDMKRTWSDVLELVERTWPRANAATINLITRAVMEKTIEI
jgi:hypothetical protein